VNRAEKQARRRARAVPPPSSRNAGCAATLLAVCGVSGVLWIRTGWSLAGTPGILCLGIAVVWIWRGLQGAVLAWRARRAWGRRVLCLVVYSDSDLWNAHVDRWLERLGSRAVVFNRSRADNPPLTREVFERFCGTLSNYSPSIVVLRTLRSPLVYRFYDAFVEAKHGEPLYVDLQERAAFSALEQRYTIGSSEAPE
jgi:hypothetical protein